MISAPTSCEFFVQNPDLLPPSFLQLLEVGGVNLP